MLPALLMTAACVLFATMGLCVKLASATYGTGEIVFYRGLIGALFTAVWLRAQGGTVRTAVPLLHLRRSLSGVTALTLWFYALAHLPLATAVTLNYMSSVWMAVFLLLGAWWMPRATQAVDRRLVFSVLAGFAGVAFILRPTLDQNQLVPGLLGLVSGMLSAVAYLQVGALGRAGEPEGRVVFYFSLGNIAVGAGTLAWSGGFHGHTSLRGVLLLLAVGVLATGAQLLMTRAYSIGRALTNASLQYLGIVFSTAYGVWLFGDVLSAWSVGGMLLIVASGLSATLLRARPRPPAAAGHLDPG